MENLTNLPPRMEEPFSTAWADVDDDRTAAAILAEDILKAEAEGRTHIERVFESYDCTVITDGVENRYQIPIVERLALPEARAVRDKLVAGTGILDGWLRRMLRLYQAKGGQRAKMMMEAMKADNSRPVSGEVQRTQMYQAQEPAKPQQERKKFLGR